MGIGDGVWVAGKCQVWNPIDPKARAATAGPPCQRQKGASLGLTTDLLSAVAGSGEAARSSLYRRRMGLGEQDVRKLRRGVEEGRSYCTDG